MKKFYARATIALLGMLCSFSFGTWAQTSISIGTATTTSNYSPVYMSSTGSTFKYSNTISLYTAAELGQAGTITSLAWKKADMAGYTAGDATFKIYMKETSSSTVPTSSGTFAGELLNAELVYSSNTQNLPTDSVWVDFILDQAFQYTGASNLMVLVDWYRPSAHTASNPEWYYTDSPGMAATWSGSSDPPSSSYGGGYTRPNIMITFAPPPPVDAAVLQINSPTTPVAPGLHNVEVSIGNFGSTTLTGLTLDWSVNGILQSPHTWSGNLPSLGVDTAVTVGSYNFTGGNYEIKVWAGSPNGGVDSNAFNDTAATSILAATPLNGTYTIGGTSPDFPNLVQAVNQLVSAGVSGPVAFNIASGTYNEQVHIQEVPGASSLNNISFQSATGNAADVEITYNAPSSDNYTVFLDGADHITFSDLTLIADDSSYARVFYLANGAEYNTIDHCVIISQPEARDDSDASGIYDDDGNDGFNTYTNNEIWNGYYGAFIHGEGSSSLQGGVVFENNVIRDFYYYGAYFYHLESPVIRGNEVYNHSSSGYLYGISCNYCDGAMDVSGNKVNLQANGTTYGLRAYYCDAADSTRGIIANNMVAIQGTSTSTCYGLYVYQSSYQRTYYNSVNLTTGSTSARAAYYYNGNDNINLNNVFVNTGGGYALYVTGSPLIISDHTNYYTPASPLAYWGSDATDLAAMQTASGQDLASASVDPLFSLPDLLYPANAAMDNLGVPVPAVAVDIDGNPRDASTPDAGCFEFTPPQDDAGIVSIDQPLSPIGPGPASVSASLKNFGQVNLLSCNLNFSVNGGPVTTTLWTGNLSPLGSSATVNIGTHNFTYGNSELKVWTSDPNLNADPVPINDTMTTIINVCDVLNGTYTIGDTNSGADFAGFNDAINAMLSCGVSGNVVFNVNPGTYNEQVSIPEVPGASLTNRITFQSSTGNPGDVVLKHAVSGSSDNWVWRFDGADYISLQNMTIEVDTPFVSYGRVVVIENEANYLVLDGNILTGQQVSSSSSNYAVVYSPSSLDNFNLISNNTVNFGSTGIYVYGSSSSDLEMGNIIDGNIVNGFDYYGIYAYYQDAVMINGNELDNSAASTTIYGIYLYYCDNAMQVNKNRLNVHGSGSNYGIRVYYCDAQSGMEGMISNNFIAQTEASTGSTYGIYFYNSTYQKIYYNSINIESTSSTARGHYHTGTCSEVHFVNNMVSMPGGGTAVYLASLSDTSEITWMDYNVLYSNGGDVGYASGSYPTLADWQGVAAFDANSVSADPAYLTSSSLYPSSAAVNGTAIPLMEVLDDIDGNPRSQTTPDAGAAEFDPPSDDMSILSWDSPLGVSCGLSSTEFVTVSLYNNGLTTQSNSSVSYSVDGGNTWSVPELVSTPIPAGDTLQYTFSAPADLSQAGVYSCLAVVSATGDINPLNDTVSGITVTNVSDISTFPFIEDFSTGSSSHFGLNSATEAHVEINSLQGQAAPALFFTGGSSSGFSGGSSTATPTQAWVDNVSHHAAAQTCFVDPTGLSGLKLTFDLKMEYSYGEGYSWFRVLLNDTLQLTALDGTMDFHPATATSDPFTTVEFDLTPYLSQPFTITLQSSLKYAYGTGSNNGDNAYVDNIQFYEPLPNDVGVSAIMYPMDSICANLMTDVIVEVKNYGGVAQDSIPVYVEVVKPDMSTQIISTVYSDSLLPNATDMVNVGTLNTPLQGAYQLSAYTMLPGDVVNGNDSSAGSFSLIPPLASFPYLEDFESFSPDPDTLRNGWSISPTTGFIWEVDNDGTPSSSTGPDVDHTLGTANGLFMFTEASNGSTGDEAYLQSPCLELDSLNAPELRFWYHMYGSDIDQLAVDIQLSGSWIEVFSLTGPQQSSGSDPWLEAVISLTNYKDADRLRFRVKRGSSYEGDVAVDDIQIQEAPAMEAELTEAFGLVSGCDLTQQPLSIKVYNKGAQLIHGNLSASYQVDGGTNIVAENITDSIVPGDTLVYTFTTPVDLSTAVDSLFVINAWIDLSGDADASNDSAMTSVNSRVSPAAPQVDNVTITQGIQATLVVQNADPANEYHWYDLPSGGTELAVNDTFVTPVLNDTTIYYVEATGGSQQYNVGPVSPAIGSSAGFTATIQYQIFDVLSPTGVTIESVDLYPTASLGSAYTMVLEDALGNVLDSMSGSTTVGSGQMETVNPGFVVPQGTGYQLGFSVNPGMTRNNSGAVYPYEVTNVISITGNTFDPDYYYFFYNMVVSVSGGNGCPSARIADTVFVIAPVVVADAGNDTSMCTGSSVQLMVNATGGVPPYTYNWSPATSLDDPVVADPLATPMTNTTYSVTVSDQNGDSGTDDVIVQVIPLPNVQLDLSANDSVCLNSSAFMLSGGSPAGGVYSGPGVSGGMFDPALAGAGVHTITYSYTDPVSGCTGMASDDIFVDPCTGLMPEGEFNFIAYPNPTKGIVVLEFSAGLTDLQISVTDMHGRAVSPQLLENKSEAEQVKLDLGKLPAGIYTIKIIHGKSVKNVKVARQ